MLCKILLDFFVKIIAFSFFTKILFTITKIWCIIKYQNREEWYFIMNDENEELELNRLMQVRKDKLKELQDSGKDPFEITKYDRTEFSKQIKDNYGEFENKDVSVARKNYGKKNYGKSIILYNSR